MVQRFSGTSTQHSRNALYVEYAQQSVPEFAIAMLDFSFELNKSNNISVNHV